jgi:hypothetical protein
MKPTFRETMFAVETWVFPDDHEQNHKFTDGKVQKMSKLRGAA